MDEASALRQRGEHMYTNNGHRSVGVTQYMCRELSLTCVYVWCPRRGTTRASSRKKAQVYTSILTEIIPEKQTLSVLVITAHFRPQQFPPKLANTQPSLVHPFAKSNWDSAS